MNVRVSGVIIEHDAILLIRHDYGTEQLWHIPGGNLNKYEKLNDALSREYKEELDVIVDVGPLWLVCDGIHPDGVHVLHCIFMVKLLKGEPKIQAFETSGVECNWIPLDDLVSMKLYPNIKDCLIKLREQQFQNLSVQYLGRCQSE